MKIMYVNCEYINEYRSNPRINEHCLSISENKVQIPYKPEFFSGLIFPQFWPDIFTDVKWCFFSVYFIATFAFDRQLNSLLLWFLAYSHLHIIFTDFTVLTLTLQKTAKDDKHIKINSGLRAIPNQISLQKQVWSAHNNTEENFSLEERAFTV